MSIIDQGQTVIYNKLVFRFNIVVGHADEKYPDIYVQIFYQDNPPPISEKGVLLDKNKDFYFTVNDTHQKIYAEGYINYNIYDEGAGVWGYFHYDYGDEYADCVKVLSLSGNTPISPNPPVPPQPPYLEIPPHEPDEVVIQNVEFFDLFHFSGLRRPGQIPKQNISRYIFTKNKTPFYQSLLKAAQKQNKAGMEKLAKAYLDKPEYKNLVQILETHIYALINLYEHLLKHPNVSDAPSCMEQVETCFGKYLEAPIKLSEYFTLKDNCIDGINALMILYEKSEIESLETLILVLRLCEWVIRSYQKESDEQICMALKALIIIPDEIFDLLYPNTSLVAQNKRKGYVRPLGIGELMIVRERPIKYEAGEIARIENIMKHAYQEFREEDRSFEKKGEFHAQDYLENQDQTLHQDQDLLLRQRLSNLADGAEAKFLYTSGKDASDTDGASADAENSGDDSETGLTKKYSNDEEILSGGWTLDFNPKGNYTAQALNFAKTITGKVSRKLRQKRHHAKNHEVRKEKSLLNKRIYDNKANGENITGIYRWVNKVSEARLINVGHRLIIEFLVPDPAEGFVGDKEDKLRPISPAEELIKNLSYTDMTPDLYRELAAHYPVETFIKTPKAQQYLSASLQSQPLSLQNIAKIPEGYQASKAYVSAVYSKGNLEGFIGNTQFSSVKKPNAPNETSVKGPGNTPSYEPIPPDLPQSIQSFHKEIPLLPTTNDKDAAGAKKPANPAIYINESIPYSVLSTAQFFNVNIDILCELTDARLKEWQLKAYRSIIDAYEKQEKIDENSYEAAQNRKQENQIVINQLIQACSKQLLQVVEPKPKAWEMENYAHFVRQAFLWEEMAYWFMDSAPFTNPGQTLDWANDYQNKDQLADFNQFLHAKAAKVHVAVRNNFEQDALFFIWSQGKQWAGLDTDAPIKEHYLFYANELLFDQPEELQEGTEIKSWKIRTPTQMQILQKTETLPEFP